VEADPVVGASNGASIGTDLQRRPRQILFAVAGATPYQSPIEA